LERTVDISVGEGGLLPSCDGGGLRVTAFSFDVGIGRRRESIGDGGLDLPESGESTFGVVGGVS
jgi:hypothetical protein